MNENLRRKKKKRKRGEMILALLQPLQQVTPDFSDARKTTSTARMFPSFTTTAAVLSLL